MLQVHVESLFDSEKSSESWYLLFVDPPSQSSDLFTERLFSSEAQVYHAEESLHSNQKHVASFLSSPHPCQERLPNPRTVFFQQEHSNSESLHWLERGMAFELEQPSLISPPSTLGDEAQHFDTQPCKLPLCFRLLLLSLSIVSPSFPFLQVLFSDEEVHVAYLRLIRLPASF